MRILPFRAVSELHQTWRHVCLCSCNLLSSSVGTFLQVALSNLVGINNRGAEVLSRVNASVVEGRSCKLVAGRHNVCFFPCMRYNYCHTDQSCCTDAARLPVSLTTLDELMAARVKVHSVMQHL